MGGFGKSLSIWFFLLLLASGALVYTVDPTGYWTLAGLHPFGFLEEGVRKPQRNLFVSKALAVTAFRPHTVITGTSQTGVGIDADSATVRRLLGQTYNLYIPGASVSQLKPYLDYVISRRTAERIVLGLSIGMFNSEGEVNIPAVGKILPQEETPFLDDLFRHKQALWTGDNLLGSLAAALGDEPTHSLNGNKIYQREGQLRKQGVCRLADVERRSLRNLSRMSELQYRSNLDDLEQLLKSACRHRMEAIVFIHPHHVRQFEIYTRAGRWKTSLQWKRDLAGLLDRLPCAVPLFDFSGVNAVTSDPLLEKFRKGNLSPWYWESNHYRHPVGDMVVQGLAGQSRPELPGARLTAATVESHIRRQDCRWRQYRRGHPDELADMLENRPLLSKCR
ncbi:MAG: hypothetical protein ACU826_11535 [Gammaproteobacteria bacterium]